MYDLISSYIHSSITTVNSDSRCHRQEEIKRNLATRYYYSAGSYYSDYGNKLPEIQLMFLNFGYELPAQKAETNRADPDQTAFEEAV